MRAHTHGPYIPQKIRGLKITMVTSFYTIEFDGKEVLHFRVSVK